MDDRTFLRPQITPKGKEIASSTGSIWVFDANIMRSVLADEIARVEGMKGSVTAETTKVMNALTAEEGDVFGWIGSDGRLMLRSVIVRCLLPAHDFGNNQ